ncbi:jouberin-like isoform X1 [Mytilus californianus]|uniref:jouberin-like isoform X1 n=1 Tax=Mytilus californianus TaxID=6549 RepID=UPI0022458B45|nr:jouberin-like isoform X1 [Mytilus californianus]
MAEEGKVKKTRKLKAKSDIKENAGIEMDTFGDSAKSKLDILLQQAVVESTSSAKAKKKKKKDDSVLESLRKGEGLQKEEDAAIKANTYDPNDSPKNMKSNKRKQKIMEENAKLEKPDNTDKKKKKKPIDDTLNEQETEVISPEKTKKKKKKPPDNTEENEVISPPPEEALSPKGGKKKKKKTVEEIELSPPESEEVLTPKEGKKKKKKPINTEPEEDPLVTTEEAPTPKPRKPRKKKEVLSEEEPTISPREVETPTKTGKKKKKAVLSDEERPVSPEPSISKERKKKKAVLSDEERPVSPEPSTSKEKKKKKKKGAEDTEGPTVSPREDEEVTTPEKKKKKKKVRTEEEGPQPSDDEVLSKTDEEEEIEKDETEEKQKEEPKKKKGKTKAKTPEEIEKENEQRRKQRAEIEDVGQVLSVTIHRTDKLKNDFHILHPLVRVHIVDENTGEYLLKQTKDRPVTAYFETKNEAIDKILPIMTQPFDFKQKKSVLPVWEELLLFNENYNYFTKSDPKVIVLFELLDFVSMNHANVKFSSQGSEGGWYRIAWAFLKVLGNNNKLNTGSKVRLQLFEPPSSQMRTGPNQPEVYQWWKSSQRRPYPSTVYVTLKGITPPDEVEPALRSMFATQKEEGFTTYQDLKKSVSWGDKKRRDSTRHTLSSWTRLVGQTCRIPNHLENMIPGGRRGCYVLKFSHDGRSLACGCHDRDSYPILVYEVPSFELKGKLKGHFGIVYDLSWSKRDTHLCSASSDGTVRVWNLEDFDKAEKILPHPAYVYTSQFHPRIDTIVVTGCYDQVIRVWDIQGEDVHGNLKQEIESHKGYVNSVCFDSDGQKMYSADSIGSISIWNVFVTEQPHHRDQNKSGFMRDWTLFHTISDPELKDTPINHLKLHHSGRRLLVHSRDNIIRMVDLRVQRVMQKYIGHLNFREQIRSTITPCGSFVFSGSEDNLVYAWHTETGDQVVMYTDLNYRNPVTDVDYHPRDHMIAMCSVGENQPIIIYNYDPHIAQMEAGLSPRHISPEPIREHEETIMPGSPRKEELTTNPSSMIFNKEEFNAHTAGRYEKVLRKLHSATTQMAATPSLDLPGMTPATTSPQLAHTGFRSLDPNMTPRTMMASPATFSPHSTKTMSGIMQQQQFRSQNMYMKTGDSDWRPGFTDVGRYGARSTSPTFIGRPPQLSMTAGPGKAQFSFQAPAGKAVPSYKQVIALYNYRAQRSDELTIFKGDVISILYKDSDSWWMGELPDGQQGYFPSNYVAEEGADIDAKMGLVQDSDSDEEDDKKVTAVRTKTGELKFISATEESEDELLSSRKSTSTIKRHRRKKKRDSLENSEAGSHDSASGKRNSKIVGESNA